MSTAYRNAWSLKSYPNDKRMEARVTLGVSLFIKCFVDNMPALLKVKTENVSLHGARIIIDEKIDLGTKINLSGFNGMFNGIGVVRYCKPRNEGGWLVGIQLVEKNGSWIIKY